MCLVLWMGSTIVKCSNSTVIRCLGGEGNFSIFKRKNLLSRFIWALKAVVKLTYMLTGYSVKINTKDLIYLCGVNQDRLLQSLDLKSYGISDEHDVIKQPRSIYKKNKWPFVSIDLHCYWMLVFLCLVYVVTGNNRYIAAFLIRYYKGVSYFLNATVSDIERLICLNDQPFEAAALTLWAREQGKNTIVLQHGVILSYNYYYPSNSKEFWAWGENGRLHFKTRVKGGKYVVKGRFLKKEYDIPGYFILPDRETMNGVVCPSFSASEIVGLIKLVGSIEKGKGKRLFSLKLHPSTKFKFVFRLIGFFYGLNWINYKTPILEVAKKYDFLVTKNSSTAVDFLLLGKPVFGIETPPLHEKIFNNSFFSEDDMKKLIHSGHLFNVEEVNDSRISFIRGCTNKL